MELRAEGFLSGAPHQTLRPQRAATQTPGGQRCARFCCKGKAHQDSLDSSQQNSERGPIRRNILAGISGFAASWMAVESAHALSKKEVEERRTMLENQKSQLEYLLEQQRNVNKAKAAEKEQEIESQASQIETKIQQQITADRAAPDKTAEVPKLEGAIEEVKVAEAKAEAEIVRQQIVEEAKVAEQEQQLDKAAMKEEDELTKSIDAFVEDLSSL